MFIYRLNPAKRFVAMIVTAFGFVVSTQAVAQETALPLGTVMPAQDVALVAPDGSSATLGALAGETATVVAFWSNACPWTDRLAERLRGTISRAGAGVTFVLVNSNDAAAFPKESARENGKAGFGVPYLSDTKSAVAAAFGAARSPHFFVFDAERTLVYVGSLDDSPGDADRVTKRYVTDAIAAARSGGRPPVTDTKAFGCMIKPVKS